jgi:selenocysteine-specific elongation factor
MDAADVREAMLNRTGGAALEEVAAAVLAALEADGTVRRTGTVLRRVGHAVSLGDRRPDADRLVELVAGGEPTPPTQRELEASGFDRALIDACVSTGLLARVSPEVVVTPDFLARAEKLARSGASSPDGLTVSRFRELLGTTRKYALPILGFFDERGITRRDGDVRRLRD